MSEDSAKAPEIKSWKQQFKKRHLSDRQLKRVKVATFFTAVITAFALVGRSISEHTYNGEDFVSREDQYYGRGRISYFFNSEEACKSFILTPAWYMQPKALNAVLYLICLSFIFVGVSIISDIFMDSITVITSAKRIAKLQDENGNIINKEVEVWNSTVANLTLMALGSSAPEIMLNVIEMLMTLGQKPGELGPSTIVGSAAFNLLIISGVSILSVNESNDSRDEDEIKEDGTPKGVKKIDKVPVFILTTIFSILAYVWMWYVLLDEIVDPIEAWITFGLFWVLIAFAYGVDLCIAKNKVKPQGEDLPVLNTKEFISFLKENEEVPEDKMDEGTLQRTKTLKSFLSKNFETDDINQVNFAELKEKVEGEKIKSRSEYRKGFMDALSGKKPKIKKGEEFKREENLAKNIDDARKNDAFGFYTLNYTISEACKIVVIKIENKKKTSCSVGIRTVEQSAQYEKDFKKLDKVLEFKNGQQSETVEIEIVDDDDWSEDRDFTVELYNVVTGEAYKEIDTVTSVLIIDDDKPGNLAFAQKKGQVRHVSTNPTLTIDVSRTGGADGKVTCKWKTFALKSNARSALEKTHFNIQEGVLELIHASNKGKITLNIPQAAEGQEPANNLLFGVKLSDPQPRVCKIKRDTLIVELVADSKSKKQADALQEWLDKMEDDEKLTWSQQIKKSVQLYPQVDEDGNIEEVGCGDAVFHFVSVFWKVLFSFNPPPHYGGGWPCFFGSLAWIGVVTLVVAEIANLMGCVLNILPGVTAITFVAIGTSIPDTFASKIAAQQERYADEAIGNVTGSNSVNVFLGLGIPWIIATIYGQVTGTTYRQESPGLAKSVLIFLVVSLIGITILVIRRFMYKGELGGPLVGRIVSCALFIFLWFVYITISTLGSYKILFNDSEN